MGSYTSAEGIKTYPAENWLETGSLIPMVMYSGGVHYLLLMKSHFDSGRLLEEGLHFVLSSGSWLEWELPSSPGAENAEVWSIWTSLLFLSHWLPLSGCRTGTSSQFKASTPGRCFWHHRCAQGPPCCIVAGLGNHCQPSMAWPLWRPSLWLLIHCLGLSQLSFQGASVF